MLPNQEKFHLARNQQLSGVEKSFAKDHTDSDKSVSNHTDPIIQLEAAYQVFVSAQKPGVDVD